MVPTACVLAARTNGHVNSAAELGADAYLLGAAISSMPPVHAVLLCHRVTTTPTLVACWQCAVRNAALHLAADLLP